MEVSQGSLPSLLIAFVPSKLDAKSLMIHSDLAASALRSKRPNIEIPLDEDDVVTPAAAPPSLPVDRCRLRWR